MLISHGVASNGAARTGTLGHAHLQPLLLIEAVDVFVKHVMLGR